MKNKSKNKINWKLLIICIIIVYAVAFMGSLFTSGNTNTDWYQSIKPKITPPSYIFPIVWNILFFLISLSLYFSWKDSNKKQKNNLAILFGINFLLNILWSIIFFEMKLPIISFFELILLWISTLLLIISTNKINKLASFLLYPYILWLTFAGILNFIIAFLN